MPTLLKISVLLLILISSSYSGERIFKKNLERIRDYEGHYTTPSSGCIHKWHTWRPHGFEQIREVVTFDSIPPIVKQNLTKEIDSAIGQGWDEVLSFVKFDVSGEIPRDSSTNKNNRHIIYAFWFTYKTSDTAYYSAIYTDSIGLSAIFADAYIIKNRPERIRSLEKVWEQCVNQGALSHWSRPLEVFLRYNKKEDQFNWVVYYYKGFSYFIGPKRVVKINAETGKVISNKRT